MNEMDRTVDGQRLVEHEMGATLFYQAQGEDVRLGAVAAGLQQASRPMQLGAVRVAQPRKDQFLGEIGRDGDADQARQPRTQRRGDAEHDPAAHAGADQDKGSIRRQLADSRQRVVAPASHRRLGEISIRRAMGEIVETEERLPALARPGVERQRLSAGHVGTKPAQKDHSR